MVAAHQSGLRIYASGGDPKAILELVPRKFAIFVLVKEFNEGLDLVARRHLAVVEGRQHVLCGSCYLGFPG